MIALYVGEAGDSADAVAPDGIPIHLVLCDFHTALQGAAMGAMRFLGIAEGRIPTGEWGVHAHASLEQVTYVLEGEVILRTRDPSDEETRAIRLTAGQAVVTLPAQSLSFANEQETPARVLFICAPPYPADDGDTLLLAEHRPLAPEELRRAIARQEEAKASMARLFDERIAVLQGLLARGSGPSAAEAAGGGPSGSPRPGT
jgi:mannose-6-phosphate isomerase-like protein (cupin superfamily)